MGIFSFFRSRNDGATAKVAKDRLQVLIAHERSDRSGPDFLPLLRQDILEVIKKYVQVNDDSVSVSVGQQDACDVLELNITLPEEEIARLEPSAAARRRAQQRRAAAQGQPLTGKAG